MANLPRPVTATDIYLAAILDELKNQRPKSPPVPPGYTELREPVASVSLSPIPRDFPGVVALNAAGIQYLEDIPRNRKELLAIRGIGPFTVDEIAEALG